MNVYARKDAVWGERLLCNREVLKNRNEHCRQNSEYRKKAYCNKNIRIFGDLDIIHGLAVCYAVTLEHRNTIEFQTLDFYSRITHVMHIAVEPVNGDTIHAVIMIAANEYLLRMQKVAEPDQKIKCFRLTAVHDKITGVYNMSADGKSSIRLWQPCVSEICNIILCYKDKALLAQSRYKLKQLQ